MRGQPGCVRFCQQEEGMNESMPDPTRVYEDDSEKEVWRANVVAQGEL
jgi:hypothetical protein